MPIILTALYQSRTALLRTWTSSPLASRFAWSGTSSTLKMSTFQHPEYNIPITLPTGLSKSQVLNFHPFNSWLSTLQTSLHHQHTTPSHPFHPDPYTLHSITIQSHDLFGSTRLGFVKLTSHIANAAGETLPGAVFLRGPSVAMLVMLLPEDDDGSTGGETQQKEEEEEEEEERYVLLTVQPRVAAGSLEFVELPAGMVDDAGDFVGQAAKEIEEELGMVIGKGELVSLSDLVGEGGAEEEEEGLVLLPRAVYPSAGGCDEYIPIYMHERRVPRKQLGEWTGKLTGLREHGEKVTLKLVRMRDLWKEGARDAKCLAAVALWEGLRREGKV
ncbi:hypothetical protein C8A00DRAFT_40792 [Chaetomidium leptoderma]|uniref:Nudix hydrolase domain-containing protein n=1 Tax=Chaetomidium leptoderma TaxID=669021 RepID=A0AAN6VS41_9PEZI|nr:hypothetical protein C8A00DRAFT_40792 [Chaetomidium leptoderma]